MISNLPKCAVAFAFCLTALALMGLSLNLGCNPPRPHPQPNPSPKPEPAPEPPEAAVSVVILYDAKDAADLAAYADPALDDYCASHGQQLRLHATDVVDEKGKTPAYLTPYLTHATGKRLPIAMIGRKGAVKADLEQPKDAQAVIALIEKSVGDPDAIRDIWAGGSWRRLGGVKPAKPGANTRWPVEGTAANEPLLPEDQWREIDLTKFVWAIRDQDGYSSCCPTSGCTVMEIGSDRAGLRKFALSALDAYARINGGRDAGATLEDFLAIATEQGVCTSDFCQDQGWRNPQRKAGYETSRAKHRILRATWCPDWASIASALQRRKPVQFGLLVDSRFSPDANGVIGRKTGRSGGGHAVTAAGMRQVGSEWHILMVNSWGTQWGGSRDGTVPKGACLLHPSYVEPMFGAWALASVVSPSDDPIAHNTRTPAAGAADTQPGQPATIARTKPAAVTLPAPPVAFANAL